MTANEGYILTTQNVVHGRVISSESLLEMQGLGTHPESTELASTF